MSLICTPTSNVPSDPPLIASNHSREFGPSDPRNGSFFKGTAIGRQAAEEFRVHMSTMFNSEWTSFCFGHH